MTEFDHCDVCKVPVRTFSSWNLNHPQAWLLPCLHVICNPCRVLKCQSSTNPQTVICPVCRTESLKNAMLFIPDSKSCTVRCETPACPEKKTAAVKCLSCNEKLCNECGMAHRRVTATSNHILQPVEEIIPEHCRCPVHSTLRAVCYCTCGLMLCPECLLVGIHDGTSHSVSSIIQLASTSGLDVDKVKSSTVQELAQVEAGISSVGVRKQMLVERIDDLKKEIGNNVVKACNAIVKRGWDMINTLDFVKKNKVEELDGFSDELQCQQLRFNRVNAFVDTIKGYDEPTAVVLTKAFLNNCVNVIKMKKLHSEKNINVLQRPPQVEAKINFDQIITMAGQCGQIYVESSDGLLLPVEIRPAPRTPANVFHFDASGGGIRPQQINCAPSTSGLQPRMPVSAGTMSIRPRLMHGPIQIFQQQQHQHQQRFRTVQEAAMRHVAQAMHRSPVQDPRLAMFPSGFRPSIVPGPPARYPIRTPPAFVSSAAPVTTFRPEGYVMPNGQIVSFNPRHPVSLSNPIPATTLMEHFNGSCGRNVNSVSQSGVVPRCTLSQILENVEKGHGREVSLAAAEFNTIEKSNCISTADSKLERQSSSNDSFSSSSTSTTNQVDKSHSNAFVIETPLQSTEANDEKNIQISCFSDSGKNTDHNAVTVRSDKTEDVVSDENSGSGGANTSNVAFSPSTISNKEERSLNETEKTGSEPEHVTVCASFFEQEEVSPPLTPADSVQDGSNVENTMSHLNGKLQQQSKTPSVKAFEDKTDQLQSDSEDRGQDRNDVALVKELSDGKSVMEKSHSKSAEDLSIKKSNTENEMDNAEEESSGRGEEISWDDYCYVCQQGCDERTGSLGCCAKCPRVFHNCCHIPAIKEKMENLPDEWECSLCTPAEPLSHSTDTMGARERLLCSKVLLRCYEDHENVQPFCHPVSKTISTYYAVIKKPMDFGTIARRLREKAKDAFTDVSQFILNMNLVFENCSTFNHPDAEVAVAGRKVYQYYVRAVDEYLPCMKNLLWLYITLYSESKITAAAAQKEICGRSSRSRSIDKDVEELGAKRPRRDLRRDSEPL